MHHIQEWLQTLIPSSANAPFGSDNSFAPQNFRELFYPITFAALLLLIVSVVLYNVQVRKLHKHPPLVALQEWLLWTAVCVFGLVLVEAVFHFWFLTVVLTLGIGIGVFIWIRFIHFPPQIEAYNRQLVRARSMARTKASVKYQDAQATVRTRKSRRARR